MKKKAKNKIERLTARDSDRARGDVERKRTRANRRTNTLIIILFLTTERTETKEYTIFASAHHISIDGTQKSVFFL